MLPLRNPSRLLCTPPCTTSKLDLRRADHHPSHRQSACPSKPMDLSHPATPFEPGVSPTSSRRRYCVPAGAVVRQLVGEGAANVVVEIELPPTASAASREHFKGKLLRLQKAPSDPKVQMVPYPQQYAYWQNQVRPLFADSRDLVEYDLAYLGDDGSAILNQVDIILARMDQMLAKSRQRTLSDAVFDAPAPRRHMARKSADMKTRKKQFYGSRLARVPWAMVVEDMRINRNEEQHAMLLEIKPKWLLQSPSAPAGAIRCRNCALQLSRQLRKIKNEFVKPCPLLLVSESWRDRNEYVARIFPGDGGDDEAYRESLRRWFRAVPGTKPRRLLLLLQELQEKLDGDGPLAADMSDGDFQLAMTLRDCSVFLQVYKTPRGQSLPTVVAKLGDLDQKPLLSKLAVWQRNEQDLIDEGAYTAEYRLDSKLMKAVPIRTGCLLERGQALLPVDEVAIRPRGNMRDQLIHERDLDSFTE